MNTILIVILTAVALYVCALICKVWLARRRQSRKPQEPRAQPPLRPFILKIIEMIEKGDYSYTPDVTSLQGTGYREVYKFALETDLKCEVARTHSYSAALLLGSTPCWWLYVDGRAENMTLPEQDAITDALTKVALARRERERREEEAKRAPLIAAIESYTVVDRRTSQ